MTNLSGKCLCGDVKFEIRGNITSTSLCHCSQCRRWAGHAWPSANVQQDDLVLLNGSESLAWYNATDHAERGFCVICGSSLFWRKMDPSEQGVAVALGTLDMPTGLKICNHLHLEDKSDYYTVDDEVKK